MVGTESKGPEAKPVSLELKDHRENKAPKEIPELRVQMARKARPVLLGLGVIPVLLGLGVIPVLLDLKVIQDPKASPELLGLEVLLGRRAPKAIPVQLARRGRLVRLALQVPRVRLALKAHRASKVRKVRPELPEPQVLLEPQVLRVHQVHRVIRVPKEIREPQALPEPQVLRVHKVHRVIRVPKEIREPQVLKVRRELPERRVLQVTLVA
jgi:hypothetical protein